MDGKLNLCLGKPNPSICLEHRELDGEGVESEGERRGGCKRLTGAEKEGTVNLETRGEPVWENRDQAQTK